MVYLPKTALKVVWEISLRMAKDTQILFWVIFPKTILKVIWEISVGEWLKITVIFPKTVLK